MALVLNGSGTIAGLSAGGLPDGSVAADDIVDGAVTATKLASTLDLSGKTVTLPTVSNLTLSGGVYLGGTGSANYLDDYEEGTFTPELVGTATAGTWTGSYYGKYTKVGDIVTVYLHCINVVNSVTSTGQVRINGLPFASSSSYLRGAITVPRVRQGDTARSDLIAVVNSGVSYALLYFNNNITGEDGVLVGDIDNSNNTDINLMMTYHIA